MSSDLLAEFDSFYRPTSNDTSSSTPALHDLSFLGGDNHSRASGSTQAQPNPPIGNAQVDIWGGFQPPAKAQDTGAYKNDDIWGLFEGSKDTVNASTSGASLQSNGVGYGQNNKQSKPKPGSLSTLNLFASNGTEPAQSSKLGHKEDKPSSVKPKIKTQTSFSEVLFDASDEIPEDQDANDDDDEFGDFESGTASNNLPSQPPHPQSLDVLFGATSLGATKTGSTVSSNLASPLPYPKAPKSPSFQERNPCADLGLKRTTAPAAKIDSSTPKTATPVTAWPVFKSNAAASPFKDSPKVDDDWGDFVDLPPETHDVKEPDTTSRTQADAWAWDPVDNVSEPAPETHGPPPTNVPPPSILLSLFPQLFDLPQSALFKPVASQNFSLKHRILSDPTAINFLRGYLLIVTVAARIIAGRKLRWKRDTLLSQAVKIGPAAAGGGRGMKLTGIDKAEVAREDREASEVGRVWKEHLGRLRSAITVANSGIHKGSANLIVPEIEETMSVKTQEGGVAAPKPCIVCGLKRDERVNKVDIEVEDSFGEWWTEHWGHNACKNFWLEHEKKLRNR